MKRIVLFGAPGSGKGTMADFIQRDFGYLKISTGDLIREEMKQGSALGERMKAVVERGQLVSDELIVEMVRQRLAGEDGLKGYILDGFPRTLAQAENLALLPAQRELAVFLEVAEEELIRRLVNRMTCGQCGAIYNLNNMRPRREGICDQCGGPLVRRLDDNEETIRQRIRVYHQQTMPVIEWFQKQGKLVSVSGAGSPAEVYLKVKKIVP